MYEKCMYQFTYIPPEKKKKISEENYSLIM